jgi:hypothetical protein
MQMNHSTSLFGSLAMRSRFLLLGGLFLFGIMTLVCTSSSQVLGDDNPKGKKKSGPALPTELDPKLFTLQGKEILLSNALAELEKQTGNHVDDRRASKDEALKIKLDLQKVTFWQALDAIAKEADAKVSVFERDGKISLADGPHIALPVSHSGLFRVTAKRINTYRALDTDSHLMDIFLEVAWEPRFQPLLMETRPESMEAQDDKGRNLEIPDEGKQPAAVNEKKATEVQIRLPAAQRSAGKLTSFKGKLAAMGPSKTLTYTFDKLTPVEKKEDAKKLTQDGVTVQIRQLKTEGEAEDQTWTIAILLEYPGDGPKFESFQSWVVNNAIYLEKEKDGVKQQFPRNLGYEVDEQSDNKALIIYRFGDDPANNLVLGKLADWKLVYKTPGKIAEIPIPFEFKDLPLP